MMYEYYAIVRKVIDGDTVLVDVDLGMGTWKHGVSMRLHGCNAREVSDPGGKEARDYLASLLPEGVRVTVRSHKAGKDLKPEKYGRYTATITLPCGVDLVSHLIDEGWAVPWDGRGARPVPDWPRKPKQNLSPS